MKVDQFLLQHLLTSCPNIAADRRYRAVLTYTYDRRLDRTASGRDIVAPCVFVISARRMRN